MSERVVCYRVIMVMEIGYQCWHLIFFFAFERATECQRNFCLLPHRLCFLFGRLSSAQEEDVWGRCFDVNFVLWKFVPLFNYNDYHQEHFPWNISLRMLLLHYGFWVFLRKWSELWGKCCGFSLIGNWKLKGNERKLVENPGIYKTLNFKGGNIGIITRICIQNERCILLTFQKLVMKLN